MTKGRALFISTLILVIIHLCGLIGLLSPYRESFLLLTPFNLFITAALLFFNHSEFNTPFFLFCSIAFTGGFLVEVAGVHTDVLFGEYEYGNTLGFKIMEVPVVMGFNWLMLIYSIGVICYRLKTNAWIKSILGALMMVALDLFIEPVAIRSGFWSWNDGAVPLQNYIAWFIASFILLRIFYAFKFNKENGFARALYIVQLVFFVLLTVLHRP